MGFSGGELHLHHSSNTFGELPGGPGSTGRRGAACAPEVGAGAGETMTARRIWKKKQYIWHSHSSATPFNLPESWWVSDPLKWE